MQSSIVIIGPMDTEDARAELERLERRLVNYFRERHQFSRIPTSQEHLSSKKENYILKKGDEAIRFENAVRMGLSYSNNITIEVVRAIDQADLVVADLTDDRPAVVYELALAQALGIKTILLGRSKTFYLRQFKRSDAASRAGWSEIEEQLGAWFEAKGRVDNENPITSYYGAALPDISAAVGLAASFFDSYVRLVLAENAKLLLGGSASEHNDSRAVRGLMIVDPTTLSKARAQKASLSLVRSALEKAFKEEHVIEGRKSPVLIEGNGERRKPTFVVRDYVIDLPRALYSLHRSPRLERMLEHRSEVETVRKMEKALIDRFFDSVEDLMEKDLNIKHDALLRHGPVEDLVEIIKNDPEPPAKAMGAAQN